VGTNLDTVEEESGDKEAKVVNIQLDEGLILFNMVVNAIPHCQYPSSKICAMEIIKSICSTLNKKK